MPTTLDIPTKLVKKIYGEKPYYYKGYQKVLSGESTFESIMGSPELQSTLVSILNNYLWAQLDPKVYKIPSGDPASTFPRAVIFPMTWPSIEAGTS